MVRVCNVCRLEGRTDDQSGCKLFRLPKNIISAQNVLKNLGFDTDFIPNASFRICENHFTPESIIKQGTWRLVEFPQIIELALDENGISEQFMIDEIANFEQGIAYKELVLAEATERGWKIEMSCGNDSICFFFLGFHQENGVFVTKSVTLSKKMTARYSVDGKRYQGYFEKITKWTQLKNLILHLETFEREPVQAKDLVQEFVTSLQEAVFPEAADVNENGLSIAVNIMQNLVVPASRRRFDIDTLGMAISIRNASTVAYRIIRGYLPLPGLRVLSGIARELHTEDNHKYFSDLSKNYTKEYERVGILVIDEIYLDPRVTYWNGKIEGLAEGSSSDVATTMLGIMFRSLFGDIKEIVRLVPLAKSSHEMLAELVKETITFLHECRLEVVWLVMDANRMNQALVKFITGEDQGGLQQVSFKHPSIPDHHVYVSFDWSHLMKNLRNGLIRVEQAKFPPLDRLNAPYDEWLVAEWKHLQTIYTQQSTHLHKTAFRLKHASVFPNNFDRVRMKLVGDIVHETTIAELSQCKRAEGTTIFLKIFRRIWLIMTCTTAFKWKRLNEADNMPFTLETLDDGRLEWMQQVAEWLKVWHADPTMKATQLTRDTSKCLIQAIEVFVNFVPYILKRFPEAKYLLPSHLNQDPLEDRFGLYRRQAGTNYKVTPKQLVESEKKCRVHNILKRDGLKLSLSETQYEVTTPDDEKMIELLQSVLNFDCINMSDNIAVENFHHIAGFCAKQCLEKLSIGCGSCFNLLADGIGGQTGTAYHAFLQRGGLLQPSELSTFIVKLMTGIQIAILKEEKLRDVFLQPGNKQKVLLESLTKMALVRSEVVCLDNNCSACGTSIERIIKLFFSPCANTLLRNYSRVANDQFLNDQWRRKKSSRVKAAEVKKKIQKQLVVGAITTVETQNDDAMKQNSSEAVSQNQCDEETLDNDDEVHVLSDYIEHLNQQDALELTHIDFSEDVSTLELLHENFNHEPGPSKRRLVLSPEKCKKKSKIEGPPNRKLFTLGQRY